MYDTKTFDKLVNRARIGMLARLARRDHEQNCCNEPPWPRLSINHRDVHDKHAIRAANRHPK